MQAAFNTVRETLWFILPIHTVLIQCVSSYGEKYVIWRQITGMFKYDVLQLTPAMTVFCCLKAPPETGAK